MNCLAGILLLCLVIASLSSIKLETHMVCAFNSDHIKTKERVMQEHEAKLGDFETHATKSADEIREKLQRVQNSIK